GGDYHIVFVTPDGKECSFRGTYLEIEPPTRTVATWLFEGWPDADAVETVELHETDGVTTLTTRMAFRDEAGRAHMNTNDGQEDNVDGMKIAARAAASGAERLGDFGDSLAATYWVPSQQDDRPRH